VHGWWCYRRISKLSVDSHMQVHCTRLVGRWSHCSDVLRIYPTDPSLDRVSVHCCFDSHRGKQSPLHLSQSVPLLDSAAAGRACLHSQVPRSDAQ
jgi:hypothetical protein